jgi:N-acyl-phosphatidylethanolamine-hydrolysing phospholipase D
MLVTPTATIYYGADSGYFIGYREIGRRYPGIDYALLPTTAYHPRWFMHYNHMDVREAIDAFQDLGARYMIPTQWGAFPLGNEPVGYAALELKRTIKERGLDPSRFLIADIGQIVPIAGK